MHKETATSAHGVGFISVLPFLFFIVAFFGISIGVGDFYAVPMLVAFVLTAAFSFVLYRKRGLEANLKAFCSEAGDFNVILMVLIFLLAGAFGSLAKEIGSIAAVVNLCLTHVPPSSVIVGLFVVCCFISLSMGSSMGTVIAMSPIAVGIAEQTGVSTPLILGAVLGGAMFGDNLSSISDTTIAAVRTQGCEMGDKFRQNFWIVLPAALATVGIYASMTTQAGGLPAELGDYQMIKIVPYLFVLIGALAKVNVLILLFSGVSLCAVIGLYDGQFDLLGLLQAVHRGMAEMEDLSVLSLVAAGSSGLIKAGGGLDYLLGKILGFIRERRTAEYAISFLAATIDVFTANNTIAIVIAGPIARDIAERFRIPGKRSASLLDIFAAAMQGIIPYGAQVLSAVSFAKISPLAVVPYNFYAYLTIICGLAAIRFDLPSVLGRVRARCKLDPLSGENNIV